MHELPPTPLCPCSLKVINFIERNMIELEEMADVVDMGDG